MRCAATAAGVCGSSPNSSRTVRRVVDKLLHTPTVQIKRLAEGPDGAGYAAAVRELFGLDPHTPAAVAAQRSGDVLAALEAPVHGAPSQVPPAQSLPSHAPSRRTTPSPVEEEAR